MGIEPGSSEAYAAGVSLALVCSFLNATGLALQKRTHRALEGYPKGARPYYKEKQWLAGIVCMAIASVASLLNFGLLGAYRCVCAVAEPYTACCLVLVLPFASCLLLAHSSLFCPAGQARASAFASITLVNNAILAHFALGEKFTRIDAISTATVAVGITIAIVFGSAGGGAVTANLDEILSLLHREEVYIVAPIIGSMFIGCEMYIRHAERLGKLKHHYQARLECFCRAFLAGLCSGTTGLTAKCVVVSCTDMASSGDVSTLKRYEFWLMLLALPVSLVLQVRALNGGLRFFAALELIPIYQASIVVIGVVFGWVFYAEDDALPTLNAAIFAVGCSVSILGISFMACKPKPATEAAAAAAAATALAMPDEEGGTESVTQRLLPSSASTAGSASGSYAFAVGHAAATANLPVPHSVRDFTRRMQENEAVVQADPVTIHKRRASVSAGALVDALEAVAPSLAHALTGAKEGGSGGSGSGGGRLTAGSASSYGSNA